MVWNAGGWVGVSDRADVHLEQTMQMHTVTGTLLGLGRILTACSGDAESTASRQSSDGSAVASAGSEPARTTKAVRYQMVAQSLASSRIRSRHSRAVPSLSMGSSSVWDRPFPTGVTTVT